MRSPIALIIILAELVVAVGLPSHAFARLAADATGGYSWGSYSSPGESEDTHAGAGVDVFAGWRTNFYNGDGIEIGGVGLFSFPEISVPQATENAAFSFFSVGAQAGYLWRNRFEPVLEFYPYSHLSQTKNPLSYTGFSFGGGAKLYLTERDSGAVQVGLKFNYLHQRYSHASYSATISKDGSGLVTGNSYEMGLFIGI
jgi:hypothetical protein